MAFDEVIDTGDPNANMYGCTPCPECNGKHRYPMRNVVGLAVQNPDVLKVVCNDCGYVVSFGRRKQE